MRHTLAFSRRALLALPCVLCGHSFRRGCSHAARDRPILHRCVVMTAGNASGWGLPLAALLLLVGVGAWLAPYGWNRPALCGWNQPDIFRCRIWLKPALPSVAHDANLRVPVGRAMSNSSLQTARDISDRPHEVKSGPHRIGSSRPHKVIVTVRTSS